MTTEIRTSTGGSYEASQDLTRDTADDGPDQDPASRCDHEPDQGFREDECAAERRDHRGPIGDQRGRIVEQRLAFDQRPNDPRRPEPAEDRRGGQGVSRADDRSERERRGPAQTGHQGVGHERHQDHREQHQPDRETNQRGDVRAKIADRGFRCGGKQQRRQEDEQDQVGLEFDPGKTGDEGKTEATKNEQRRIGHADPTGDLVDDRDGNEDQQDCGQGLHIWPSSDALCWFGTGSVWWAETRAFEVQRSPGSHSPSRFRDRPSAPPPLEPDRRQGSYDAGGADEPLVGSS